jgi:DNA-binding SARP family transcriptional activator/streptogramin lyase
MPASVKVRLLGGLELTIDGAPVALAGMRQKAVLALLVLSRDRTLSVDRIVDDLWGDAAPATARKAVQVYVSQLRRALGDQAGLLATDEAGYRVSALIATDVDAFERLVDEGRELLAAGHAEESAVRLRDALALWRGDPLADFTFEAFARDEIARLDDRRLSALELRLEADLRAGRHADIAAELERLVHTHPLRERLRAQLMLALYRSGRQSEALQVYQDGRRLLADELGIDPGPELRTLQAAILAHDPELAPPRRLRSAPRRPRALVALGGLLVLAAAVAAAAVELTAGGGTAALAGVSGNEVGVIDPSTNTIVEQVPVGETPTNVEVGDGAVWVLNADSRTISRIDPQTGTVQSNGTGATPAGIAIGGGAVWVSYASTTASGHVRIQRLNPDTLALGRTISLPQRGVSEGDQPLVYAAHALWVVDQANDLDRVAAGSGHVRTVTRGITPPIASGDGAVWAATTGTGGTTALVRVDLKTGAIRRLQTPIVQLQSIAVGAGAVWATDGFSGSVWRIQDTRPVLLASVHVGLGADAVAVGGGAVWVASGIDGTVTRIDLHARRVLHTVRVGDTPQGLAYGAGRVWVSVAGGGGEGLGGAQVTAPAGSLPALPQSVCGPVIYAGPGRPQYLIASDLPLDPADAPQTRPMVEAIKFVLREHNFRAGRNRVGYQSCDDSTAQVGSWTAGKCQANAASFVSTGDVIGVIGPFNSGCATEEIPITNRGGLAMVSPTNSYIGLTRAGPGALPGDPARLYPTGVRTYTRVYPPDDAQAAADAVLATQLGAKRV